MLFDQTGNRKYLTSAERRTFIAASKRFDPETETFCLTLIYTGARISEVLALTPARVDTSAQMVIIECLKKRTRGIFRSIPVPRDFLIRLETVHRIKDAVVHPIRKDGRIWPWGRTTAWQRVKAVMAEANIPTARCMPKALRHSFGVAGVVDAQVPLNMMQKWLGHAKIETTAIYANAVGPEERSIAERMWEQ